jgi:pectinesterase
MNIFSFIIFTFSLSFANEIETYDFIVDINGSGDFIKVQDAINAVPDVRNKETRIYIKNGVYKEKLILAECKINVSLIGEDVNKTIITYDDYASKKNRFGEELGTSGSSGFFVYGHDFKAKNITFENSAGPIGQAVAVRIDADKVYFDNCRFLGFQDTLYPHGRKSRQYYKNCYIEGTTDFIFGWSTAVFENCEIFSKEGGNYITAASTEKDSMFGFVFIHCKLTGNAPPNSVYLGRPWRDYAKTVFIECDLGPHITKEGWHNWNKPQAESTSFYAEYKNTGSGSHPTHRVKWSHHLSKEEAAMYTKATIFNDWIVD